MIEEFFGLASVNEEMKLPGSFPCRVEIRWRYDGIEYGKWSEDKNDFDEILEILNRWSVTKDVHPTYRERMEQFAEQNDSPATA